MMYITAINENGAWDTVMLEPGNYESGVVIEQSPPEQQHLLQRVRLA